MFLNSKNTVKIKKLGKKSSDDSKIISGYSASIHTTKKLTAKQHNSPIRGGSHSLYISNNTVIENPESPDSPFSPTSSKRKLESSSSNAATVSANYSPYTSVRGMARTLSNSKNKTKAGQKNSNDSNHSHNSNNNAGSTPTVVYKLSFKLLCKELGIGPYSNAANKIMKYLKNKNFGGIDQNSDPTAKSSTSKTNDNSNFRFVKNIYFSPASAFTLANFFDMYYQINNRPEVTSLFMELAVKNKNSKHDKSDKSDKNSKNNGNCVIGVARLTKFLNTDQRDPRLNEILHPYKTENDVGLMIKRYNTVIGECVDDESLAGNREFLDQRGFYFFMLGERGWKYVKICDVL